MCFYERVVLFSMEFVLLSFFSSDFKFNTKKNQDRRADCWPTGEIIRCPTQRKNVSYYKFPLCRCLNNAGINPFNSFSQSESDSLSEWWLLSVWCVWWHILCFLLPAPKNKLASFVTKVLWDETKIFFLRNSNFQIQQLAITYVPKKEEKTCIV